MNYLYINKNVDDNIDALYKIWLDVWYTFQTFKELDDVEDKKSYTQEIRDLLDEDVEEADDGTE